MSIYIPPHFRGDEATGRRLMADHPFATLFTASSSGAQVSHLPLLLDDAGTELVGHMARANPHWQALAGAPSVAVFHGPHAFVSRGWYSDPADNVPTWNYAAVHASGTARLLAPEAARAAVERLAARFEPPTLPAIEPDKLQRLQRGVVAFALPIERVEVKLKMSQNKPAGERAALMAALRATGGDDGAKVAAWMEASP